MYNVFQYVTHKNKANTFVWLVLKLSLDFGSPAKRGHNNNNDNDNNYNNMINKAQKL